MAPHDTTALIARKVEVTANDRGPLVNTASWISMIIMCLAVLTRLGSKYIITRGFGRDDLFITAAMVMDGLGRHLNTLSPESATAYQQSGYAAELLFVPVLALAKLSLIIYLFQLTPQRTYHKANRVVMWTVVVWGVISFFVVAFQCKAPQTWAIIGRQCFDQTAFWGWFGALDMVTEIAIVALPTVIVSQLQMDRGRKIVVIGAFASRLAMLPIIVLRLVYIGRAAYSPDHTFDDFNAAIVTQVDMNMSIFVSCILYLKPFFENLPADCLRTSEFRHRDTFGTKGSMGASFHLGSRAQRENDTYGNGHTPIGKEVDARTNEITSHATVMTFPQPGRADGDESESRTSTGSDKMIIKQTKGWSIQYDEEQEKKDAQKA
ncbi:MAG: hypothetical protein M1838_005891 [Thelocarpon superellum]|nr:MAG: hypothetical protein M1838_005891 [Thelocarpon superellum]